MKHRRATQRMCAILTCAFLLAAGRSCRAEAADFLGTWYLNVIEIVGQPVHPSYLHAEETLTIFGDGRIEVCNVIEGEAHEETAEWILRDGELIAAYSDGTEITYTRDGDSLCMENEVMRRVYGREKLEGFVEPVPRTDALRAEFNGLWSLTYVTLPGWGTFPWERLFDGKWFAPEESWLLRIEDDSASWIGSSEDAADFHYSCSMEGGRLRLDNGGEELYAELNTDGTLSCHTLYPGGEDVVRYFERAD